MKPTITFTATLIIVYLIGAFINSDFNPLNWDRHATMCIATISLVLGFLFAFFTDVLNNDKV